MKESVEIFLCYAREDEALWQGLAKQLRGLQRQGLIDVWYDRKIAPGSDWEHEIGSHLNTADIILLLVSSDFIDSDYCYGIEMKRAIERHERGEAHVIPIILRHVYWERTPFGKLQALPKDAKPATDPSWHTLDIAFYDIAEGIREAAEALLEERRKAEALLEEKRRRVEALLEEKRKQEYLLLKQRFDEAYTADDSEAILAAYGNIQRSSHRDSFSFSSVALQRIDLALRNKQFGPLKQVLPPNKKPDEPKVRFGYLKLTAADKTDVGEQAEQNEDCVYKRIENSNEGNVGLFIVADGIGESKAGEVASKLAVETIRKTLDSFFKSLPEQPHIK